MGPKTKRAASSDMDDQAALALCLIELLNDDQVLDKLRRVLYPRELSAKIDSVNDHIGRLKAMLTEKEERIKFLEVKVAKLEENADSVDQYGRRANLHIRGVPESMAPGEDTDELVLRVLNEKMDMTPKVELHQLVRTHRLGRANDDRQRQPRPIIVRFASERLRDVVFKARVSLKTHNQRQGDAQIYLNDDLTAHRSKLAYEARLLKRAKKITDTWTAYGKVMVKTLANQIKELKLLDDLLHV